MNERLGRNIDRLLLSYPTAWRAERGAELKHHLAAVTSDVNSWPSQREARRVVVEGLRARARGSRTSARDTYAVSLSYSLMWGVGLMFGVLVSWLAYESDRRTTIAWVLTAASGGLFAIALTRNRAFATCASVVCATASVAFTAVTIAGQGGAYERYVSRAISWRTQTLAFSVLVTMFVGVALLIYGRRKSAAGLLAVSGALVIAGVWDLAAQVRDHGVVPRVGTGIAVVGTVWADGAAFLVVFGAALVAARRLPTDTQAMSRVRWLALAPVVGALLGSGSAAAWGVYALAVILSIIFAFINPCPAIVLTCAPYTAGALVQWLSFGLLTIRQPIPEPVAQRSVALAFAILTMLYLGRSTRRLHRAL